MARFAADTSVIVAALCTWHEEHAWSAMAINARLDRSSELVLAFHGLFEAYAVLTRLPPPHRLAPDTVLAVLEGTFRGRAKVAGLPAQSGWRLLRKAAGVPIRGGRTYDAVIAWSIVRAGATELLTLNPRHFEGLVDEGALEIIGP